MNEKKLKAYTEAARKLLPPGVLWEAPFHSTLYKVLEGVAKEFVNLDEHLKRFLKELNPQGATEDGLLYRSCLSFHYSNN